jgi:hypothetical protein
MSKKVLKKAVLFFTGIALMLVLLGCAAPQPAVGQISPTAELPAEVVRLSLEDAKAAFDDGTAVFLDVRSNAAYAESHIPGALSIPLAELEARINELDPNRRIITYCT